MSYAVQRPDGSRTYFNPRMCGVFDSPLELARRCAAKCNGTVLSEDPRPTRWQRDGVDIHPRWQPLD